MWLTLLALRNRIGLRRASPAMVGLGASALNRLPRDLFPNSQVPVAFVGVIYKGAPPIDIEQSVVYPIEKAVSSASNVEHVESFAKQGIGAVQVWFNWGADINVGQMEVMQRVTQILNQLPSGILQPFIVKFDVSNIPAAFVTVSGGNLDERGLYDLAFNTIAPQVEQLPNVAAATVEGGKVRQININLDPAMLQARGLSILDVVKAVKASNLILPSGDLKAGNLDYNVFTNNQFKTVEPINDVIVKATPEGTPVRVKDLGTVTDSSDIQTNIVRTDGQRSVYLRVNKQPIANTVEVVDALRRALPKMIGVPPGVKLGVSFDQSVYIRQSIKNLIDQAIEGSVLAAAVILVFLRNVTSTLIFTITIALFTSFFVSRTVTPALCYKFVKPEREAQRSLPDWLAQFLEWSRGKYETMDTGYQMLLTWSLSHRRTLIGTVVLVFVGSLALGPLIGSEFIPITDESQFRIIVRAPVGQRVEKTEQQVAEIERDLRETIKPQELETVVSSVGVLQQGRSSPFNPNTGPPTALIQVYLVSPDKRTRNQIQIMNEVRPKIVKLFPGVLTIFDPGGIVKRVTSFGSQAPVDVEIYGYDMEKARQVVREVDDVMHKTKGLADIQISREENYPEVNIAVDREKAALLGISETDVANAVLYSLNGNGQTDPIIYTDPSNGNENYISAWLAEPYRSNLSDLERVLITTPSGSPVLLSNA